ncbi:hypothetical protein AB6A40_006507 [Gnathostoma spinigerum]|uniref:LysM domain-containing protein n=1 Tax=Gnathostoma spinigerum TaxID=75299 RepID=A0ABD6ES05_9BILA
MDYEVSDTDTIERIAALHDCTVGELVKMNKLGRRMLFPGERIIVPVPLSNENEKMNSTKENDSSMMAPCSENDGADTSAESSEKNRVEASVNEPRHWDKSWSLDRQGMMKWRKGPGTAVPVQAAEAGPHVRPLAKANSTPVGKSNGLIQDEDSDVDTDCLRRFIKIQLLLAALHME